MLTRGEHMEIRNLLESGVSVSEAARILGVARATLRKYTEMPSYLEYVRDKKKVSKLEPYKEYVKARLEKFPLSSIRIYDEIKTQGYGGKLTILRGYMRELSHEKNYHAVKMFETQPGQQAQIDWGYFGKMQTNEGKKKIYGFCMVLGYSRTRYIEFTNSMNVKILIKSHINAFKYYGGAPHEGLYDNMKQVVLERRKTSEESQINPLFSDFMAYHGIKPKLCRVRKPRTKGKVEKLVDYAKGNFFLGLEFTDLNDLNMKARVWMDKVNSQPHSMTKEPPFERLKKEQPLLIQIEGRPDYRISETHYRKARNNCLVSLDGSDYSVPPKFACKEVEVRLDEELIRIFHRGQEIAQHKMIEKGKVSFIDAHRDEIDKGCFYFPKQNHPKRKAIQTDLINQSVEVRDLKIYERL